LRKKGPSCQDNGLQVKHVRKIYLKTLKTIGLDVWNTVRIRTPENIELLQGRKHLSHIWDILTEKEVQNSQFGEINYAEKSLKEPI
jgi:hypothetical protein